MGLPFLWFTHAHAVEQVSKFQINGETAVNVLKYFLWGSIRGVLEWKEVLEYVKYMNSSSSLFKIHEEKIPLCHFRHGEIYSFPSRLPNYASYSSKDFYLNTKLVCLIPPHCYNYYFTLCVVQSSRREPVRGFAQVEWSLTDSMAFTLNVN